MTCTVCGTGREFDGAGLCFCGYMGKAHHRQFSYMHKHVKGHGIVHLGRRRHGADDITSGERLNLIIWCTNLAVRSSSAYLDLQQQREYETEATHSALARRAPFLGALLIVCTVCVRVCGAGTRRRRGRPTPSA